MFKWLKSKFEYDKKHVEYVWWDMEAERLMNICKDTGGENSPYLYKLREHMDNCPKEELHHEK